MLVLVDHKTFQKGNHNGNMYCPRSKGGGGGGGARENIYSFQIQLEKRIHSVSSRSNSSQQTLVDLLIQNQTGKPV